MFVYSNTAISLDGKIGSSHRTLASFGSQVDHAMMSELRSKADAVLVGAGTLRAWPFATIENNPMEGRKKNPLLNVVVTSTGKIPREGSFYENPLTLPVIFAAENADLQDIPEKAKVHFSKGALTLPWVLNTLRLQYAVQNLLIEAGGTTLFQLLENDLIHEMNVTLCPLLIGGSSSPTLCDGTGFAADALRKAELQSVKQVGSELFLGYKLLRERSVLNSDSSR